MLAVKSVRAKKSAPPGVRPATCDREPRCTANPKGTGPDLNPGMIYPGTATPVDRARSDLDLFLGGDLAVLRSTSNRDPRADPEGDVTRLLLAWSEGDRAALERVMPLVEQELRRIAKRYFNREEQNHTLEPTALVNEVYLRLVDRRSVQWKNRSHFFGFAAEMMRRILVDHARVARAEKRGAGRRALSLEEISDLPVTSDPDVIALDDALDHLAEVDERQSRVVELRYFAGLKNDEIAEVLGISTRTVKREWRTARLWLYQELRRC